MKLDPVVKKETGIMAAGCLICTAAVMLVFIIIGKFDYTVALGGLVGLLLAVGNHFCMAVSLSHALETGDENIAKQKMRSSYVTRSVVMLAVMAAALIVDFLHWLPVIASVFYPRIVIFVRGLWQTTHPTPEPEPEPKPSTPEDTEDETDDEFEKFVGHFSKGPIAEVKPDADDNNKQK